MTPFLASNAFAGVLKSRYGAVKASDFYDYEYAKMIWNNYTTLEALEAEEAKYDGGFDEWLNEYMTNKTTALRALPDHDDNLDFQRRYDIQLAYDEWWDDFYGSWWRVYQSGDPHRVSFDQWLIKMNGGSRPCQNRKHLNSCGPRPDWRSEQNKADEKVMTAETDRLHPRPGATKH